MANQEQLDKCARLLSTQATDDERMAGLVLLPRIIDAKDSVSLKYLLEKMDPKFIERLLRTGIKQISSSHQKPKDCLILNIALSVIAVFAAHKETVENILILERIPTLTRIVLLDAPGVSEEALNILCQMLSFDAGARWHLNNPESILSITSQLTAKMCQFLDFAMNRLSQYVSNNHQDINGWWTMLASIADVFESDQTIVKFALIPVLANALEPLDPDSVTSKGSDLSKLVDKTVSGCVWILRQKSEQTEYSDQALVLFSHLARLWPESLFTITNPAGDTRSRFRKNAGLVLRLACVEGQSAIDSMMICEPTKDTTEKDIMERGGWKLSVCDETMAGWVEWLEEWVEDQGSRLSSEEEEEINAIMKEIKKLARANIGFLIDWKERAGDDEMKMLDTNPKLVLGTVHLLGKWFETIPELYKEAIPLLNIFTKWIRSSNGRAIKDLVHGCAMQVLMNNGLDIPQYLDELRAHKGHGGKEEQKQYDCPWIGTIDFDDLVRAIRDIPTDEELLEARKSS